MEEHRDEFDDPGHRLMMEMYTRQMGDIFRRPRWWIRLGMMIVALAGGAGLLLAIGFRTHETPDSRGTLVSTSRDPASKGQTTGLQERTQPLIPSSLPHGERLLLDQPEEQSRPALIRPSSGSRAGHSTKGVSASPKAPRHPQAVNMRPSLMSKQKQGSGCPEKDCLHQAVRQRSIQLPQRSLRDEFDPNAALVLGTD